MTTPKGLVKPKEAAAYLGVSISTLLRLTYKGEIASVKVGTKPRSPRRYRIADLEAYIAAHTKQVNPQSGTNACQGRMTND